MFYLCRCLYLCTEGCNKGLVPGSLSSRCSFVVPRYLLSVYFYFFLCNVITMASWLFSRWGRSNPVYQDTDSKHFHEIAVFVLI